jgi:hypothetical protein
MKLIFLFILFSWSIDLYSQNIPRDKLIGEWVFPNNKISGITFDFIDSVHLRLSPVDIDDADSIAKCTYKLTTWKDSTLVLTIYNKKFPPNDDSCFIRFVNVDTLELSGGFWNKPLNDGIEQMKQDGQDYSSLKNVNLKMLFCRKKHS